MKGRGPGGWRLTCAMRKKRADRERLIAELAANQHGVLAAHQLATAGLPDYSVTRRVKAGRLHRLHRGVYAVGHTNLSFEGRCTAAALAVGDSAVVSHRSAAPVWGFLPQHTDRIDVTVPGDGGRRKRRGITVHRSSSLIAGVVTRRNGVPVTKPARTLRDLRQPPPAGFSEAAVRRALASGSSSRDLDQSPTSPAAISSVVFVRLCRRHRVPQPEANARLGPYEVDFLWRDRASDRRDRWLPASRATAPPSNRTVAAMSSCCALASEWCGSPPAGDTRSLHRRCGFACAARPGASAPNL